MARGWMIFAKILNKQKIFFYFTFNFSCYYCSKDFKRQSEPSRPRPDTSSFVCCTIEFFELGVVSHPDNVNCSQKF